MVGRLVPESGLRNRAEGIPDIECSTKLPLPVLRVDVVVIIEIEFVGVEGDLRRDEPTRVGSERVIVFRRKPIDRAQHNVIAQL